MPRTFGQLMQRLGGALPPSVNRGLQTVDDMQHIVANAISSLRHRRHASPVNQGQPGLQAQVRPAQAAEVRYYSHPSTQSALGELPGPRAPGYCRDRPEVGKK